MIKRYLIKSHKFWNSGSKNGAVCLVKHDPNHGGIYAYVRGTQVKLVSNQGTLVTDKFADVQDYMSRVIHESRDIKDHMIETLNRRYQSNRLRQLKF